MSLLFNMLSRLVSVFLPRSKCLLISCVQSPSAMILEPTKIKTVTVSIVSPFPCHEVMGPDAMILAFWVLSQFLNSPLSPSSRGFLVPLHSAIRVVSPTYLKLLIFLPEILIPAYASASLAFHMMYSEFKLNNYCIVTIYNLDIPLSQFSTSPLFHVPF